MLAPFSILFSRAIIHVIRAFLIGVTALFAAFSSLSASEMPVLIGIGGDFIAVSSDKQTISNEDLLHKPVLLAFGYTNCADICPITVGYMRNVYDRLTPEEQQQVRFIFVTVDPEYDTPEHLNAYLAHFNSDFIGITGTRAQIDKIVDNYKVGYHRLSNAGVATKYIRRIEEKQPMAHGEHMNHQNHSATDKVSMGSMQSNKEDEAKLYTHSAHLFVIDKQMQTRSLAHTGTPSDELANSIRELIAE